MIQKKCFLVSSACAVGVVCSAGQAQDCTPIHLTSSSPFAINIPAPEGCEFSPGMGFAWTHSSLFRLSQISSPGADLMCMETSTDSFSGYGTADAVPIDCLGANFAESSLTPVLIELSTLSTYSIDQSCVDCRDLFTGFGSAMARVSTSIDCPFSITIDLDFENNVEIECSEELNPNTHSGGFGLSTSMLTTTR